MQRVHVCCAGYSGVITVLVPTCDCWLQNKRCARAPARTRPNIQSRSSRCIHADSDSIEYCFKVNRTVSRCTFMSPDSSEEVDVRRYGGVNGNDITLTEKRTGTNNKVIEFNLRNNDRLLGIQLNLLLFCLTLFLGNLANSLTLVTLSVIALALHCRHTTASVDFGKLIRVTFVATDSAEFINISQIRCLW